MLNHLKNSMNVTETENGDKAFVSTQSKVLDYFSRAGAMRNNANDSEDLFMMAQNEDPLLATKALFFIRDIRQGIGERDVFRKSILWLSKRHPDVVAKNIKNIPEYGRWDDVFCLVGVNKALDSLIYTITKKQIIDDINAINENKAVSLIGKWLPSENTSSATTRKLARKFIKGLDLTPREYRKMLVMLREKIAIIENNLREKDYTFDYSKQPSKAMLKYRKAFIRNDRKRYEMFLDKVERGEVKLNTATLNPVDIVSRMYSGVSFLQNERFGGCISPEMRKSLDVSWKALPDYTNNENALVVADGSGSMYWGGKPLPAHVAQSLAIYYAERNKGKFANHFITFSARPKMVEIPKDVDIVDKVEYCTKFHDASNTDLRKTFDLILNTAVKYNVPQSEMPSRLYIISDMQFDVGCNYDSSTFEDAKKVFSKAGYELPQIVFWNVNGVYQTSPVTMNEHGVALVSGYTSRIFNILNQEDFSPYQMMLDILNNDRYNNITV